ncbi:MAG: hypothetical protein E7110_05585 [Bacteroidales bacterium]|nr:hypothetical protein [Bacteroidales bacterium]MBE6246854.1 hypothetical protein [Bacteroidales bacterium]
MKIFISYTEISNIIKAKTKLANTLSYISSDKINIKIIPHQNIGEIYADMLFYYSPTGDLSLSINSDYPGVESLVNGITTILSNKADIFPFINFSTKHIKICLPKIPKLGNIFASVSISSLEATPNGFNLIFNL